VVERPFAGRDGWTWFIPAEIRYEGGRVLTSPFALRSANTSLLARAHGYVVVGPDKAKIAAGETVSVRRFSSGGRA
jgi:molybdopterin biosynthesis enzyme